MKSQITKLSTAAVLLLGAVFFVGVFNRLSTPTFAVDETIEAMRNAETVHMLCRDWDGRNIEAWMANNPETGCYDHFYARFPEEQITVVSTPTISYQHDARINMVMVTKGQLISSGARLDTILEDIVGEAAALEEGQKVEIYKGIHPDTKEASIIVLSESKTHVWKFYIDPQSRFPVAMHCLRSDIAGEFVKDVDQIYFDEQVPEGIFDFVIPEGAIVRDTDRELQLLADPQYGISTEGLTQEEAISLTAHEYWRAMIEHDLERLKQVCPLVAGGAEMAEGFLEECKRRWNGSSPTELISVGKPYLEHGCGYGPVTPCILRFDNGTLKEVRVITKFRERDGRPACVMVGPFMYPRDVAE